MREPDTDKPVQFALSLFSALVFRCPTISYSVNFRLQFQPSVAEHVRLSLNSDIFCHYEAQQYLCGLRSFIQPTPFKIKDGHLSNHFVHILGEGKMMSLFYFYLFIYFLSFFFFFFFFGGGGVLYTAESEGITCTTRVSPQQLRCCIPFLFVNL